jgi:murein DD-endopeptidase MepM/ murein hydrolase activator NlpD
MISWLIIPIFIPRSISVTLFHPWVIPPSTIEIAQSVQGAICPSPLLSRLKRHRISPGETIASIAQQYNLLPITLTRLNPVLQKGSAPPGKEIVIPPLNGIRVEVPNGATWRDLESAYGVRADILFEVNGCQKIAKFVFIPGVTWGPPGVARKDDYTGLSGYPLPSLAKIGLSYGWHTNPGDQQSFFHSGIDLLAEPGTPVLAAEEGTVAFTGQEGSYGNLAVISHSGGRQTRYAHLSKIQVRIGQQVKTGDVIGAVGVTGRPDLKVPHLHFEVRYKLSVGWVAQDPALHFKVKSNPQNLPTGRGF